MYLPDEISSRLSFTAILPHCSHVQLQSLRIIDDSTIITLRNSLLIISWWQFVSRQHDYATNIIDDLWKLVITVFITVKASKPKAILNMLPFGQCSHVSYPLKLWTSVVVWFIFPKLHIQSRSAMHMQSRLDYIYDLMLAAAQWCENFQIVLMVLCVPKKTRVHYCEWEFPVLIIQSEKWQLLCGSTFDYPAIHTTVWKEMQINLAARLSIIVRFMSLNINKFLF